MSAAERRAEIADLRSEVARLTLEVSLLRSMQAGHVCPQPWQWPQQWPYGQVWYNTCGAAAAIPITVELPATSFIVDYQTQGACGAGMPTIITVNA
jgi:hypothetical protein